MAITYHTITEYVASTTDVQTRLSRVRATIAALDLQLLTMAGNSNKTTIDEYSLDDGQTKIRTIYRNPTDILQAIKALEQMESRLERRLRGGTFILRDADNFKFPE